MTDSAKMMYEMLSFQYKPLERKLLSNIPDDLKLKYRQMGYIQKIKVLDKVASSLGL